MGLLEGALKDHHREAARALDSFWVLGFRALSLFGFTV